LWLTAVTIWPVGPSVVDATAIVRSLPAARSWVPSVATRASQPRYRSHSPMPSLAERSAGPELTDRSDTTAPPFCASPVWSSERTWRPSAAKAVPRICATVTTPGPPTPVMRMVNPSGLNSPDGSASGADDPGATGAGRRAARASETRPSAGVTVRNDGQSPLRQEKSRLQDDWWIRVLRPNSVAAGWTDRQLDAWPQSPQPSQ